jgi:hypothetical protein
MNLKKDNPHLVWNCSTKMFADGKLFNNDVDMSLKPEITFGNPLNDFLIEIYNERIKYLHQKLWFCGTDIKANLYINTLILMPVGIQFCD